MPTDFDFGAPVMLHGLISTISAFDVLDILIVAFILYKAYEMLQDTRAITLVKGLLFLFLITVFATYILELHVFTWLLQKTWGLLLVALPIVFQPELRRVLGHLGEGHFFSSGSGLNEAEAGTVVGELVKAVKSLSNSRTGALLVIERNMKLDDISATGIHIDGLVSAEFLLNVFIVNTPLHDGAAIIRGKRLIAAGCLLPLTENRALSKEMGTRHRAAIGLSEQCDALVVVVSEETGKISVAENGHIRRNLSAGALKDKLMPSFVKHKPGWKEIAEYWGEQK